MIKHLVVIILSLVSWSSIQAQTISSIRNELFYTNFDLSKCQSFHKKLVALKQANPTIKAYEAAAKALIAKHSWNPITKVSSLKESMRLLESAIAIDQMNLEIRFLRLYIENSLPSYLGMKKNLDEDKAAIINNIHLMRSTDINDDIINYILSYMSSSIACTDEELKLIKSHIAKKN